MIAESSGDAHPVAATTVAVYITLHDPAVT